MVENAVVWLQSETLRSEYGPSRAPSADLERPETIGRGRVAGGPVKDGHDKRLAGEVLGHVSEPVVIEHI